MLRHTSNIAAASPAVKQLMLLLFLSSSCHHAATASDQAPHPTKQPQPFFANATSPATSASLYRLLQGFPGLRSPGVDLETLMCTYPPLRDPLHGSFPRSCRMYPIGRVCQGSCWSQYMGAPTTTCVKGVNGLGVWGPAKGQPCVPVECRTQPPNPANGVFPPSCKGSKAGQLCIGKCAAAYSGLVNTTCARSSTGSSTTGRWSPVKGQCTKITACIDMPDNPRFGTYPKSCSNTPVGRNCTASCRLNFEGRPFAPTVKCLPIGDWSSSSGQCVAENCQRPAAPAGTTGSPTCTKNSTSGVETCVYRCRVSPPAATSIRCDPVADWTRWRSTSTPCPPDQCDRTTRPSEGAGAVGSWACAVSGQSEVCSVTCRVPPPDTATITCNLTNGANVWKNTTKFCSVPVCLTSSRPNPPSGSWTCSTSGFVQTCTAPCATGGDNAVVRCDAATDVSLWTYTQRCLACSTTNRPAAPSGSWSCTTTGTVDTCTARCRTGSTNNITVVCDASSSSTTWTTITPCQVTGACNPNSLPALPAAAAGSEWVCSTSGSVDTCTVACNQDVSNQQTATITCDAGVNANLWTNSSALCPVTKGCVNRPPVPSGSLFTNWSCTNSGLVETCFVRCRWPVSTANTTITCNPAVNPSLWTYTQSNCITVAQTFIGTVEVGSNLTLTPYEIMCNAGAFISNITLNATNNGSIGLNVTCSNGATPVPDTWIGYIGNNTTVGAVDQPSNLPQGFNYTQVNITSQFLGFNKVRVRQAGMEDSNGFIQAIGFVPGGDSNPPTMYGNMTITNNDTTLSCAPNQRIVGLWGSQNATLIATMGLNCTSACSLSTVPSPPVQASGWNCTANATGDSCRALCPNGMNTVLNASTVYCSGSDGTWFTHNSQPLDCINLP